MAKLVGWLAKSHQRTAVVNRIADGRWHVHLYDANHPHKPTEIPVPSTIQVHEGGFYGRSFDDAVACAERAIT